MTRNHFKLITTFFIIGAVCLTAGFCCPNKESAATDNNIGGTGTYFIQSNLLKKAMDYLGVDSPDKAVAVWSEGLKQRNGAMQYSVMTKELKAVYAKDLENGHENWVTGVSSPWVEGYTILNKDKSHNAHIYNIKYNTATSAGPFDPFYVKLTVVRDGDFWRISEVNGDQASTAYTGFTDQSATVS